MNISGTTRLVGLLGWPIHYTQSPRIHNAAYEEVDADYVYLPLRVDPLRNNAIRDPLAGLSALGFVGASLSGELIVEALGAVLLLSIVRLLK